MIRNIETYTTIYTEYVDELYGYAMAMGYSKSTAMDAIHDVFYRMVVSGKELGEIGNIKSYLFRSIKNRLLDMNKRKKNMMLEDTPASEFKFNVSFHDDQITTKEEREQIEEKVRQLMAELTPGQKEAIYLRYIQELEYEEIAAILKITPESARKIVYRAMENLRNRNLGMTGFMMMMLMLKSLHT